MRIAWSLFAIASAADYAATDVLAAWRSGLPEPTFGALVGRAAASDGEKACLVAAGVPVEVVAGIAGPAPAALAPEVPSVCGPLGLHVDAIDPVRDERRARAAEVAAQAARVERVSCFTPRMAYKTTVEQQVEDWMKARVGAGATGFVVVGPPTLDSTTPPPVVCSY